MWSKAKRRYDGRHVYMTLIKTFKYNSAVYWISVNNFSNLFVSTIVILFIKSLFIKVNLKSLTQEHLCKGLLSGLVGRDVWLKYLLDVSPLLSNTRSGSKAAFTLSSTYHTRHVVSDISLGGSWQRAIYRRDIWDKNVLGAQFHTSVTNMSSSGEDF